MPTSTTKHTESSTPNLLEALDLSCVRGERTLFSEVDLTVVSGHCLHIIGANGSGKTSLLRILCGLNSPDSGQIKWGGHSERAQSFASNTAYIGHKDGLKNEFTAIENLRFQQQLDGHADEHLLDDCLAKLGILRCADLPAQSLSFGQRRRLAFARLLLNKKQLWILDEPFTGIDAEGRELIEQLCVRQLKMDGAIVMTHHQSLKDSELADYRQELNLEPPAEKKPLANQKPSGKGVL